MNVTGVPPAPGRAGTCVCACVWVCVSLLPAFVELSIFLLSKKM